MEEEQLSAAVEETVSLNPNDQLDAAKEAVRKALAGETQDEAVEKAVAKDAEKAEALKPKHEKVEEEPAPAKEEVSEKEVRKALAQRAKVVKERQSAQEEASRIRQEALQLRAEVEYQRQEVQRQAEWFRQLKANPVQAIKETGVDPEEFIHTLARSGSYEGRLEAELARQKAQTEALAHQQRQFQEQQLRVQEEHQQRQAQHYRSTIEDQFSSLCLNEEKFPHLSTFYADRKAALVAEGDWIADQYREVTGREASLEDIAEYIEEQMSSAYTKFQEKKKAVLPVKGKQSKAESAKPVKVLSSKDSEKGSLKMDNLSELDDEDLLKLAKSEARKALFDAGE